MTVTTEMKDLPQLRGRASDRTVNETTFWMETPLDLRIKWMQEAEKKSFEQGIAASLGSLNFVEVWIDVEVKPNW